MMTSIPLTEKITNVGLFMREQSIRFRELCKHCWQQVNFLPPPTRPSLVVWRKRRESFWTVEKIKGYGRMTSLVKLNVRCVSHPSPAPSLLPPLNIRSCSGVKITRFYVFEKKNALRTDGPTARSFCRDAWTHLKTIAQRILDSKTVNVHEAYYNLPIKMFCFYATERF